MQWSLITTSLEAGPTANLLQVRTWMFQPFHPNYHKSLQPRGMHFHPSYNIFILICCKAHSCARSNNQTCMGWAAEISIEIINKNPNFLFIHLLLFISILHDPLTFQSPFKLIHAQLLKFPRAAEQSTTHALHKTTGVGWYWPGLGLHCRIACILLPLEWLVNRATFSFPTATVFILLIRLYIIQICSLIQKKFPKTLQKKKGFFVLCTQLAL